MIDKERIDRIDSEILDTLKNVKANVSSTKKNDVKTRFIVREVLNEYMFDLITFNPFYMKQWRVICDETNNTPENVEKNDITIQIWMERFSGELIEFSIGGDKK